MTEQHDFAQDLQLDSVDDIDAIFAELKLNVLDTLELSRLYNALAALGDALVAAREKYLGLRREAAILTETVEGKRLEVLNEAALIGAIKGKNKDERELAQATLLAGKLPDYESPLLAEYLKLKKKQAKSNLAVTDAQDALSLLELKFETRKPLVKIAETLSRLTSK